MIRTKDGQLYTGITTDIQRRWQEHCSGKGGARYFRAHKPECLCHTEQYPDRSSASKREAEIKRMPKSAKEALTSDGIVKATTHQLTSRNPHDQA